MPAGRPTLYNDNVQQQADDYLNGGFEDGGDVVPTAVGLSSYLGIGTRTIYAWRDDDEKPKFQQTLAAIQDKQHQILVNKGLIGEFHSTITKLMLANHGYSEKTENTIGTADGKPLALNFNGVSSDRG